MKEQDLIRCFSKIKPSESLVSDTIRKINEADEKQSARAGFRFSGRLASAMCALVLVLGLSIAVLYNPTMIPKSHEGESAAEMALMSGRTVIQDSVAEPTVTPNDDVLSRMTGDARSAGGEYGDYAVFFGNLDGCYFDGVTPEDAEHGVMYHCTLTFTVNEEDLTASSGATALFIDEGAIRADVYVYDADTMDMILGSCADHVYVRLAVEHGEWVVEELIPHVEK